MYIKAGQKMIYCTLQVALDFSSGELPVLG
jgi:hypothetical protein